jgi:hypothetical protein
MTRPTTSSSFVKRRIIGIGVAALALVLTGPASALAAKFSAPTYSSPITTAG